jgi:serine phosphatase RsbU (regulator of sigma subunit)
MATAKSAAPKRPRAALALGPALVLIGVALALGPRSAIGFALLVAAALAHAAALIVWLPRLTATSSAGSAVDAAAANFLQRALEVDGIEEVALELAAAVHEALGETRAVLVAPSVDGGIRVLPAGTVDFELADAESAFLWLAEAAEPLYGNLLEGLEGEGPAAARLLLKRLGGEVLLPLRHRGLLLGLGVIGAPARPVERAQAFHRSLRAYAAVAIANTYLDAETRGRRALAEDMTLANAVQESLMPDERPVRRRRYALRGLFRPMAACGGDLWLWRELAGEKVLILIGDATGHGAGPALLTAVAKGAIDAHWQLFSGDVDPGRLLAATNRLIHRVGRQHYFMTAFVVVVDTISGEVAFANAGQNFPFLINKGGIESLVARGNALGAAADATYVTHRRQLAPGGRILLFTDGLVEATSPRREAFGERRLRALLTDMASSPVHQIPEVLMRRLDEHVDGRALDDDVTAVVFELVAAEAAAA